MHTHAKEYNYPNVVEIFKISGTDKEANHFHNLVYIDNSLD
jgi:hypothetical protein